MNSLSPKPTPEEIVQYFKNVKYISRDYDISYQRIPQSDNLIITVQTESEGRYCFLIFLFDKDLNTKEAVDQISSSQELGEFRKTLNEKCVLQIISIVKKNEDSVEINNEWHLSEFEKLNN